MLSYKRCPRDAPFSALARIPTFFPLKEAFPAFFSPLKFFLSVHISNLVLIKTVHIVQPEIFFFSDPYDVQTVMLPQ